MTVAKVWAFDWGLEGKATKGKGLGIRVLGIQV